MVAKRPHRRGFARMMVSTSWQSYDGRFATMSSGLCPDDAGSARMSWQSHDGRFATMSSGLCPDDQK
jgi:hypothetical protein